MFDVRRGAEGMRELRTANIELVEDPNFKFKYSKKVSKKVTQFIKIKK